ncbi:hypothetical protein GR7B_00159 [Vibrio phage vB_VcorM_GR7B]|nr:hypothetical protein GR7B_00159 [Vibrio phage vB_VcorM_GR7B]
MDLLVQRKGETGNATIGDIFVDGHWEGTTLEDIHRDVKIKHQTRIPAGRYQVKQRKVLSNMTQKYRANSKLTNFDWHLELQNVPEYTNVYIHIGNTAKDTSGCILVATSSAHNQPSIGNSTPRYNDLYNKVRNALNNGEEVWIEVRDEYYKQQN